MGRLLRTRGDNQLTVKGLQRFAPKGLYGTTDGRKTDASFSRQQSHSRALSREQASGLSFVRLESRKAPWVQTFANLSVPTDYRPSTQSPPHTVIPLAALVFAILRAIAVLHSRFVHAPYNNPRLRAIRRTARPSV